MITRRTALRMTGASITALLPVAAAARDGDAAEFDPNDPIDEEAQVRGNPGFDFDITVDGEVVNVSIPAVPAFPPPSITIVITEPGETHTRTLVFGAGMGDFAAKMERGGLVAFSGPGGEVTGSFAPNTSDRLIGTMTRSNGDEGLIDIAPLDMPGVVAVMAITAVVALAPGESVSGATLSGGAVTPGGNAVVVIDIA